MPSSAEYWHIGETKMRLAIVTERSVTGLKRRDMGAMRRGVRGSANLARPPARASAGRSVRIDAVIAGGSMKRFAAALALAIAFGAQAAETPFAIAVHGGAGTITRASLSPEARERRARRARRGARGRPRVLAGGGTSLDAVTAAVRVLEDSPHFNAGKGAVFTSEGTNELDASIMDGATLRAGAVAGVTMVRNPVDAARAVMEKSPHVLLAGPGADRFATEQGLAIVDPSYFRTEERWRQHASGARRRRQASARWADGGAASTRPATSRPRPPRAASTDKRFGRVGDSPDRRRGHLGRERERGRLGDGHGRDVPAQRRRPTTSPRW